MTTDSKLDSKSSLHLLNELADLHSCSNALYFEARRHEDLYMWASRTPNGPSVKCHVQNIHTMDELKMTGNCLKGSRGICVFDGEWETKEEWKLLKELFSHVSVVCPALCTAQRLCAITTANEADLRSSLCPVPRAG